MGTRKEREVKKNKLRFSLVWKITLIALLPLIILAITAVIVGGRSIRSGMREEGLGKAVIICLKIWKFWMNWCKAMKSLPSFLIIHAV